MLGQLDLNGYREGAPRCIPFVQLTPIPNIDEPCTIPLGSLYINQTPVPTNIVMYVTRSISWMLCIYYDTNIVRGF